MPSEKSKYLNREPSPLLEMNQLKKYLSSFTKEHLMEIVWLNAQTDLVLWKALNAHVGMRLAKGDWEKAKEAIDYALYFTDTVSYSERGHEIIIYEMISALEILYANGNIQPALRAAEYILEKGQSVLEYFDDGWGWSCALEDIDKWISNKKESPN